MNYQHLSVIIVLLLLGILILTADYSRTDSFCGMWSIGMGFSFIVFALLIFVKS